MKDMNRRLMMFGIAMLMLLTTAPTTANAENTDVATADTAMTTNKVLVLSSYYQGYAWSEALESSIVSHFANVNDWKVEVDYLDLVANRDSVSMKQKAEALMAEHKAEHKSIVVLLGEEAWIMYRSYLSERWKQVPCVALFSGTYTISAKDYGTGLEIADEMKIPLEESRKGTNATIISDPYFVEQTLDMALQLKPETKHVALVSDTWQIGYMVRDITRTLLREKYHDLNFIDLNNKELTTEQLEKELATLPEHTTVLFDSWISQNKEQNRALYPDNAMRLIAGRITGDAVFGLYDLGIREGALAGGVYPTLDDYNALLMNVLEKIENGQQPRDMPLVRVADVKKYLNYNTLKKNNIPEELYPKDAIYYGKPMGFVERNHTVIVLSVIFLLLTLILLSIVAFYQRTIKRQTAKMLAMTKDSERGKANFIANMGNLMRSPLNAIQMGIDMIDTNHLSEDERSFLKIVNFNKTQLLNIFNDIVDLGKADVKSLELYLTDVDLGAMLTNIQESLLHGNGMTFDVSSDGKSHIVKADPKRLSQVLTYTLLNADYYKTSAGVELHYESEGKNTIVTITATANFRQSDCEELFDVFNEKVNPANSGRSNLELPLCHKLMLEMKGDISLKQIDEKRWAFVIRLMGIKN